VVHRNKLEDLLDTELTGKRFKIFFVVFLISILCITTFFYLNITYPEITAPFLVPLVIIWFLSGFSISLIVVLCYPWAGYRD